MEELSQEEKEIIKAYRRLVKETNSKNWIICNPEMMWSAYFVPISLIEKKIEELEKIKQKDEVDEFGIHSRDWWVADIVQEQFKELLDERNNTDER